jgi:prepilin-type N-terminal cleavage/methylation domain-containing protein
MYSSLRKRLPEGKAEGFTLIELLIVIVILGILAAIVVFAVGGITDKGTNSACASDYKTVQTAEEAYFAQPTTAGGGGGKYGAEASLAPKFLASPSKLHDVTVPADLSSYTITDVAGSGCSAANDT